MLPNPELRSSKVVYSGRVFAIEQHEITMPNGVETTREILKHPGAVCMVPVTESGDILMVTQYRLAVGKRLLELPAGTLEAGEPPVACAGRELQEEVGHQAASIVPMGGFYVAPGYTSEYIHLFICTGLSPSSLPGDEDEDIEIENVSIDEALRHIENGVIEDAKSVIGVLRYARMRDLGATL